MTSTATELSSERGQQVARIFDMIDRRDVDALAESFEPDGVQQLGNQPPLRGRAEIRAGNTAFLFGLAGLRHEITGLWEAGATVIVRLLVHYALLDGRAVTLPAVTIFTEAPGGLIDHYQVWFDVAPLFTPPPPTTDGPSGPGTDSPS